jgi:hypothetical protein
MKTPICVALNQPLQLHFSPLGATILFHSRTAASLPQFPKCRAFEKGFLQWLIQGS